MRIILQSCILVLAAALSAAAQRPATPGNVGVGIAVGEPTGINIRLGVDRSLDLVLGWSARRDEFSISADFLQHTPSIWRSEPVRGLHPFYGAGMGFWQTGEDANAVVQAALGFDLRFSPPIEVGLLLAPGMKVVPETDFNIGFRVSCRYRF